MNNVLGKKYRPLKCDLAIKILSVIALGMALSGCFFLLLNEVLVAPLAHRSPVSLSSILFYVLDLSPCVLLVLYAFKFHKDYKGTIFVSVILGLIMLNYLHYIIRTIGLPRWSDFFSSIESFLFICCLSLVFIAYFISVFSSVTITGIAGKIILCVALLGGTAFEFLITMSNASDYFRLVRLLKAFGFDFLFTPFDNGTKTYMFLLLMRFAAFAFYLALFFLVLKNNLPVIFSLPSKKPNPERELTILQDKFDFGVITEEEYKRKRVEIIGKIE